MAALQQAFNLGDLLKYEEDCLNYSRDRVTVAAGQNLELGAVLGRVTATAKVTGLDPAATDGSETAVGILLAPVDATLIDVDDGLMLARHGVVASVAVAWPAGIAAGEKAAAITALEARGILIRQSA